MGPMGAESSIVDSVKSSQPDLAAPARKFGDTDVRIHRVAPFHCLGNLEFTIDRCILCNRFLAI